MYQLHYKIEIDSAHKLQDSESLTTKKCLNLHGHQWIVEINISSQEIKDGMIIDFGTLKEIVNKLDHCLLNDIIENPTAENISKYLWDRITERMLERKISPLDITVKIWETPHSSLSYSL